MIFSLQVKAQVVLEREHFQRLLDVLQDKGYQVVGPTVRESAIVYETVTAVAELPIGSSDEQDGGSYRLKKRADDALFGYAVGRTSGKSFSTRPSSAYGRRGERAAGCNSSRSKSSARRGGSGVVWGRNLARSPEWRGRYAITNPCDRHWQRIPQ